MVTIHYYAITMHEQNFICTYCKPLFAEQAIICRQLFAGHMVGSWPMKRRKNASNGNKNWQVYWSCFSTKVCQKWSSFSDYKWNINNNLDSIWDMINWVITMNYNLRNLFVPSGVILTSSQGMSLQDNCHKFSLVLRIQVVEEEPIKHV